jgi:curved DNA-binding protein
MRVPEMDANGHVTMRERRLDVNIPKGVREGQHLRLAGQGGPGHGQGPAGDLYLEIEFTPDPHFRVDGRDVYLDLPVAPWEAALGASVRVTTPDGGVELTVPPESFAGRKLRLKGKGLPAAAPGDLYVVLSIALPPADTASAREAYGALASAFSGFDPRKSMEA